MAFNESLADRLREAMQHHKGIVEKKMFGGVVFVLKDKMFIGINKDDLMVRMIPERYEESLEKNGARPMDFTGKVMKGFVFVDATGFKGKQLQEWIDMGVEFVEQASSKKTNAKKKK